MIGSTRNRLRILVLLGVGAVVAATVGTTLAAFSATTDNSANTFTAATTFYRMTTGSYTGNAGDNRLIAVGYQPDLVIVKSDGLNIAVARTATMTGDAAKPMTGATGLTANLIQTLDPTGFTVGTDARVNGSGVLYRWIALKSGVNELKVGTYSGSGANRSFSGFGFSPEYVIVFAASTDRAVERMTGMTSTFRFESEIGAAARITSLDADGFSVGTDAAVNTNGTAYHYVAVNEVAGTTRMTSYLGDGINNKLIAGVGFQPGYLVVRSGSTVTARAGHHRPDSLAGTNSMYYTATANITTGTKALQVDGFQLGTNTTVNQAGLTYHYVAFKNTG